MAYMNQGRKATINAALKPVLAKYGIKGSLRTDRHSITLTLRSGAVDFVGDMHDTRYDALNGNRVVDKDTLRKGGFDINAYWYTETYKAGSMAVQCAEELVAAMKAADYFDDSDIQTDYFSTAYYFHIKVGAWDSPYVCTAVAAGV
jgi:hypothetical protein